MTWQIAAIANGAVAVAYFAIFLAIALPLLSSGQWRENRLGVATSAIFFTCALGHGGHATHALEAGLAGHVPAGLYDWHLLLIDGATAMIGAYYWTLRKTYGSLMHGAKLFEDLEDRRRQALDLNDNIVQKLTVAKLALDMGDQAATERALADSLAAARGLIGELMPERETTDRFAVGAFRRDAAARVEIGTTGEAPPAPPVASPATPLHS